VAATTNVSGIVKVLVGQTFLESLHLDLKGETNLLLLVQFGGQVGEAFLLRASEVLKIAAKLLDLRVQVTGLSRLWWSVCTSPFTPSFQ